ncbi:hypothetical protein C0992_005225 [Termitomyces sp. T32_za158]|nr:hypothetical protein C0992_005225 [Termitomyces sp. T32_za158]
MYDDSWRELGGTANMTTRIGSTMQFKFVGTGLTWVGFIPTELPHSESKASYSIDGGDPTSFVLKGLPSDATTTVYNQEFFTTPNLPLGDHTIIVTYDGSDTPLTLDYLVVTHAPLLVTTNLNVSSTAVPTTGATFTSSQASSISSPTVPSVSTPSPTPHSNTLIGPIIGGVIGGLVTIAILLFAFWWWHRRRASHVKSNVRFLDNGYSPCLQTEQAQTPSHMQAEPFTFSYLFAGGDQPSPHVRSQGDLSLTPSSALLESERNNNSSDVNRSISYTHNTSVDTSDVSGYAAGTVDQIRAARKNRLVEPIITPVVHQDSGIRLDPSQNPNIIVEDLPPMYTTT